jgi:hypothetical protein
VIEATTSPARPIALVLIGMNCSVVTSSRNERAVVEMDRVADRAPLERPRVRRSGR